MRLILCLLALSLVASAEDKKKSYEEMAKESAPIALEPKVIEKEGATLKVTPLLMEKPFLTDWFADGPRCLKVEGDKLQALIKTRDGKKTVHAFKLPKDKGKLAYDAGFGDKGTKPFDVEANNWKPDEELPKWGDDIVSRPVREFIGKPDKSEEEEKGHQLKLENADGKEVIKLGFVDKKNKLCWLHNFCGYKELVFLVDGNCRKICVWTIQGKHLFNIECRELGLDYPWVQSIDITDKGELYLGFTQKRKKADGKGSSSIQEAAFLKITGLDTIKATK